MLTISFFYYYKKDVYPYQCMCDWVKLNEASVTVKKDICSHLNMEDITDADYAHAERVWK